jgi:hypothetical protein
MNRLTAIIVATLAFATSANAKIGETYAQVYAEAQQDKDTISMQAGTVNGYTAIDVWYQNGDVLRHIFDSNAREIVFHWWADHPVTGKEIGIVQRIFRTGWRLTSGKGRGERTWSSENRNLGMLVDANYLTVLDLRSRELPSDRSASAPAPAATSSPARSRSPNDCMIVATEAYNRLKPPVSHWASIASLIVIDNGKETGHAVLFYQPEAGGNVLMYDALGTADMFTQSHDLDTLVACANERFRILGRPETFRSVRWVVGSEATTSKAIDVAQSKKNYDDWKKAQPSPTPKFDLVPVTTPTPNPWDRYPAVGNSQASSAPSTSYVEVATSPAYIFGYLVGFVLCAIPVVICFLKAKPVFGTIGILALFFMGAFSGWSLIGAIRLAKPHSWWAQKKYGAEKLQRALDRHAKLYGGPTTESIKQRIQELQQKGTAAQPPTLLGTRNAMRARLATAPVTAESRYSGEVIDVA